MEYKIKFRKGIDDLKSLYPFHGNSQGDESVSNSIEDYKNSGGWMSFVFDCELTEEAIRKERAKRYLWNKQYVKELMQKGEFGKEAEQTISMEHNPMFDASINNQEQSYPLESYKFIIDDGNR